MDDALLKLVDKRRKLLLLMMFVFFIFYFGLPFSLHYFHDWMNSPSPFMNITWGWMYAFAQIPFTWLLIGIYYDMMKKFDSRLSRLGQGDEV